MQEIATISNDFIMSKHELKPIHIDFLYLLATQIKKQDEPSEIVFDKNEFFEKLGVDNSNLFFVDNTLRELLEIVVTKKTKTGKFMATFLDYFEWDDGEVKTKIRDRFKSDFYNLIQNFSKIDYISLRSLKSRYSKKLYAISQKQINQYTNTKFKEHKDKFLNFRLELKELRDIFLGEKSYKYPSLKDFRIYTLDVAIKEINDKCDFKLSYEYLKNGRKVVGFSFKILIKKAKQKDETPQQVLYRINKNNIDLMAKLLADECKAQSLEGLAVATPKEFKDALILRATEPKYTEYLEYLETTTKEIKTKATFGFYLAKKPLTQKDLKNYWLLGVGANTDNIIYKI